jgi:hypothetical protein
MASVLWFGLGSDAHILYNLLGIHALFGQRSNIGSHMENIAIKWHLNGGVGVTTMDIDAVALGITFSVTTPYVISRPHVFDSETNNVGVDGNRTIF